MRPESSTSRHEHLLDRLLVRVGECEFGFTDDQFEADFSGWAFAACDLVTDGAALHGDDLLQSVAAVGGGGEAEEAAGPGALCRTAVSKENAGRWWHSSITISP